MFRAVLFCIVISFWAAVAQAVVFPAFNGDVEFDHRLHKSQLQCKECHPEGPKHMELDKASAHKLCIGCHKKMAKGPSVHCSDCHKGGSAATPAVDSAAAPKAQ